jgi:hypothetical protein
MALLGIAFGVQATVRQSCGDMQDWLEDDVLFDDYWHAGAGNTSMPSGCDPGGGCEWESVGDEFTVADYHWTFAKLYRTSTGISRQFAARRPQRWRGCGSIPRPLGS